MKEKEKWVIQSYIISVCTHLNYLDGGNKIPKYLQGKICYCALGIVMSKRDHSSPDEIFYYFERCKAFTRNHLKNIH